MAGQPAGLGHLEASWAHLDGHKMSSSGHLGPQIGLTSQRVIYLEWPSHAKPKPKHLLFS